MNFNIGKVFILVEGEKEEHDLFKEIFINIFSFSVISDNEKDLIVRMGRRNSNSDHIVIKTSRKPQIHSALEDLINEEGFGDSLSLASLYLSDDNYSSYLVFDKDDNKSEKIKYLFDLFSDSLDNGVLLMSYPSVQGFIMDFNSKIDDISLNTESTHARELKKLLRAATITYSKVNLNKSININIKKYIDDSEILDVSFDDEIFIEERESIDEKIENNCKSSGIHRVYSMLHFIFQELNLDDD